MRFKETLQQHLKDLLSESELELLPRGFQTLEDVIIINLKPELLEKRHEIARAYLELLPYIKSVWGKVFGESMVVGKFRTPTGLEHLAGEKKSEVIVVENKVKFKHDFTKIIFSKGNVNERSLLPTKVKPGEIILDMFAGIGYFSLMIGKHAKPKKIHAIELNPVSYQYLVENITLNDLKDVITPHHGDCADVTDNLVEKKNFKADRIIMGVFPAPKQYLSHALDAVNYDKGTVIHYEGKVSEENIDPLLSHITESVKMHGNASDVELLEYRFVKNVGVRMQHAVLDVRIS